MASKKCPVWSSVENKGDGKMYGLLLESVQYYIIQDVGEPMWNRILEHAGFKNLVFTTHSTYKDEIMTLLAESCCHVTKSKDFNQWMTFFGTCFVEFCTSYGYDKLLRVSGRHYRDFLHGIDNIHEVIRFSYPRLQSPAFLVLTEDSDGCVLLYQSKRRGFKYYVIGQLQQIARRFYDVSVNITVIEEEFIDRKCHVKFRLDFDNSAYTSKPSHKQFSGNTNFANISGHTFLKVFPFCIVFNDQLVIRMVGNSMLALLKGDNLIGANLVQKFNIRRPLIPCVWPKILQFRRVIFELEYLFGSSTSDNTEAELICDKNKEDISDSTVLLRGQMKYLDDWNMVAFLCTPLLNNLKDLRNAGLFINDLNSFDMSRDMVMAGWQHASQLERSIEEQRHNSEKITENMTKFEEWKQKSDNLLYAMIPQSVAKKLKAGQDPISTCEDFDNVTIMFIYMVGFGDICTAASPMEIVKVINTVFSVFDHITDKYNVFKVETLGDAVYMVAGGVPDRNPDNALSVAGLALELQENAKTLTEPWSKDYKLNTRIGMHTGSVVGGVVGRRMPQYCLFGDTVNTASRMQTYSQPGRIHISETCQERLRESQFVTILRGTVNIKGKGEMRTYWLAGREGEEQTYKLREEIKEERSQTVRKYSSYENALDLHAMHASTSYAQLPTNFSCAKLNKSPSSMSPSKSLSESGISESQMSSRNLSPLRTGSPGSPYLRKRIKASSGSCDERYATFSIHEECSGKQTSDHHHDTDKMNTTAAETTQNVPTSETTAELSHICKKPSDVKDTNCKYDNTCPDDAKSHHQHKLQKFKLSLPKLSILDSTLFSKSNKKTSKDEEMVNRYTHCRNDLDDKLKISNKDRCEVSGLNMHANNIDNDHVCPAKCSTYTMLKNGVQDQNRDQSLDSINRSNNDKIAVTESFIEVATGQTLSHGYGSSDSDVRISFSERDKYSCRSSIQQSDVEKMLDQVKLGKQHVQTCDPYFRANNFSQDIKTVGKTINLQKNCQSNLGQSDLDIGKNSGNSANIDPIENGYCDPGNIKPEKEEDRRGLKTFGKETLNAFHGNLCDNNLESHSVKDNTITNSQSKVNCNGNQGNTDTGSKLLVNSKTASSDIHGDHHSNCNSIRSPTMQCFVAKQPATSAIQVDKLKVLERGIKLAWGLEKGDVVTNTDAQPINVLSKDDTGETTSMLNGQIKLVKNHVGVQAHDQVLFNLSDEEC
ncbi:hypothetical protein ACF0H5_015440 [Mactra antiquata]